MTSLPTGTVTFLFTDIEGSTKLWDAHPGVMRPSLERHDVLLRAAVTAAGGVVFKTVGDAFCAAFSDAPSALESTLAAQVALLAEPWPEHTPLKVRMALHTGLAQERDDDYFGPVLNRIARLLSAGHGGQTLVSAPTYELIRDHLSGGAFLQDLGSHRLKDLDRPEQVYQVNVPRLPNTFAPLRTLDNAPNNLPPQLTSFIGREKVIADATVLLNKTRLLTLTGSGGSGKSRLSLQVAADVLDTYPDGAWLVELAPLSDPTLVPRAVAQVLGVKEAAGQNMTQTLTESLKNKSLLLLLDNCEHLLSACAQFTAALLRVCPSVRVLATSREPLGIGGETTYRVPSLTLPSPQEGKAATVDSLSQFEAVRLFIERARAVKPDFNVTNANAPALAQLCTRLDGIPLAIELAAARVRSLVVEQINDKLDSRFRILTGGDKAALPRQHTLRALVDWSYDLLTQPEKTLFARLSVFAGGWTLEASEAVCGYEPLDGWEVLDLLTSLVDKSLVAAEAEEDGSQSRYRMLETLKQYSAEKQTTSGEGDTVQAQCRDFFVALVEEARLKLNGPELVARLNRLETEHDNLRSVFDGCATASTAGEGQAAAQKAVLRLVVGLGRFWCTRGYLSEGREQAIRALEQSRGLGPDAQRLCARATAVVGDLTVFQGDFDEAEKYFAESLALFREIDNKVGIAYALNGMGNVAYQGNDFEKAASFFKESLAAYRAIDDTNGVAMALGNLGNAALSQGDYQAAQTLLEESLAAQRAVGDKAAIARTLGNLGNVALNQGDDKTAYPLYRESLGLRREVGDKPGIAAVLGSLGDLLCGRGEYQAARLHHEESLALRRELGSKEGVAKSLVGISWAAYFQEDCDAARSFCEEGLELCRASHFRDIAIMALCNLGYINTKLGNDSEAFSRHAESLALSRELGDTTNIAYCLEGIAFVCSSRDDGQKAVLLLGAANALRERLDAPVPFGERIEYDNLLTKSRSALDEAAFSEAWEQGRAMDWEQAAEYALQQNPV